MHVARISGENYPSSISRLATTVNESDHILDARSYSSVRQLFLDSRSDPVVLCYLRKEMLKYDAKEFLLCVDDDGQPVSIDNDLILNFRETVRAFPDFSDWFQEVTLNEAKGTILLVARWLCHLIGFRHRVVHLFIDHPTSVDHTLIQIRSSERYESPLSFDLPLAGHAAGTASVRDTLFKELKEELGLDKSKLVDLHQIGSYNFEDCDSQKGLRNTEYRQVFRCYIKPETFLNIQLASEEVAGIAVVSLMELEMIIKTSPERVASGLQGSFAFYLENHSNYGDNIIQSD